MYDICDKTKWPRQVYELIQDFDTWTQMVCIKKMGQRGCVGGPRGVNQGLPVSRCQIYQVDASGAVVWSLTFLMHCHLKNDLLL